MTIEAKPVVKNKYWIVERDGKKIATIQAAPDGVVFVQGEHRYKYPSVKLLGKDHNIKFDSIKPKQPVLAANVYNFPCHCIPHNSIYDLKLRLPLYTASRKSKSYFCAGYYLIKLGTEWLTEFCPKKIILSRNEFLGPFVSEKVMLDQLKSLTTHK